MKFIEKFNKFVDNKKFFLFNITKSIVDGANKPFPRFLSIALVVVLVALNCNYGNYFEDIRNRDVIAGSYFKNNVYTTKVSSFRQELTAEELALDFDNDKVINSDEINNSTQIYRNDSKASGMNDLEMLSYSSLTKSEAYLQKYNSMQISMETHAKQLKKVAGASDVDFSEYPNTDTFAISYNGAAFEGYTRLCKPFRLYNYDGRIYITSKDIKKQLKKNYNGTDDLEIKAISYDVKNDTYETLSTYSSIINSDSEYDDCVYFDIKNSNPICIISYKYGDVYFDSDLSLKKTILSNRLAGKKLNSAKIGEAPNTKYILFNADSQLGFSETDEMLHDCSKRSRLTFMTSSDKDRLKISRDIVNGNDGEVSFSQRIQNLLRTRDKDVDKLGDLDASKILKNVSSKEKTKTKSQGYATSHYTKFDPTKNAFKFGNFKCSTCDGAASFAMAEIVSNYYNYKTLPNTSTSQQALKKIKENGISSENFGEYTEAFKSYSIYQLTDEDIKTMLEEENQRILADTFFTKKYKHSVTKSTIDSVIEKIDGGKTVVAYMTNGSKATAVVVYSVRQSAIDPLKYTFYVYDPNFPQGKIILKDDDGIEKAIRTNYRIDVELEPYAYLNLKNNNVSAAYNLKFEYGTYLDYSFGNTGKFHDGGLYVGGDICFLNPVDLSKDNTISFLH